MSGVDCGRDLALVRFERQPEAGELGEQRPWARLQVIPVGEERYDP